MHKSRQVRSYTSWKSSPVRATILWAAILVAGLAWPAAAAENWFEKGLAELKAGNYPAAVAAFSLAIESVPHDFEAYNNRGFARIYTGDYEGAIADCTRAIEINPGSAKAYNNRGFARLFKDAYDSAIEDFNQALSINPRYVDAYSNRCLAWIRKGEYARAIEDCAEALSINPRSAKALYNRGFARDRQGDPAGAMGDYVQALIVNPNYVEVHNNIAWILATATDPGLRDGRRAVIFAEKAASFTPDPNILDTLAAAYAEAGRFDEAVALENRIVSLLGAEGHSTRIAPHIARLSLYEEGRPYRDPAYRRASGSGRSLESQLAELERRLAEPLVPVEYQPGQSLATGDAPQPDAAVKPARSTPPTAARLAQAGAAPAAAAPPVVRDQTLHTALDTPLEISLETNAPEAGAILFDIETVPFNGTLHGTLPHLLYTPRSGFKGSDRFTFRARNEAGNSNLATIVITVGAAMESPAGAPTLETPPAAAPALPESAAVEGSARPAPPTPSVSLSAEPLAGSEALRAAESAAPETAPGDKLSPPPAETGAVPAQTVVEGLPPDSAYTIQVRSVKSAESAAQMVARFRGEGLTAFSQAVDVPERGLWHRVYINGYPNRDEARSALAALDAKRFKDAFVRSLPAGVAAARAAAEPPIPAAVPAPTAPAAEPEAATVARPAAAERPAVNYPYAYQVKSYREKAQAYQLGLELTAQGYTAFLGVSRLGDTGYWQRVYVGCFRTPEEAEKLRDDLLRDGFADAFLTYLEFGIEVAALANDPNGDALENRLLGAGFLPYHLPRPEGGEAPVVMVGGFRAQDDAQTAIEALSAAGFEGRLVMR